MRKSKQCTLSDLLCVFLVLFLFVGCIKGQRAPTIHLPRGITGLELGMTPEQIGQLFTIKEDVDPVAAFLIKYGEPGKGEKLSQQNQALQKQFFRISSGIGKLPEGVTSADVHTTHKIVSLLSGYRSNNNNWLQLSSSTVDSGVIVSASIKGMRSNRVTLSTCRIV